MWQTDFCLTVQYTELYRVQWCNTGRRNDGDSNKSIRWFRNLIINCFCDNFSSLNVRSVVKPLATLPESYYAYVQGGQKSKSVSTVIIDSY